MKKIMIILIIVVGASAVAFGQTKVSKDNSVEARIVALEKSAWEAWKNKDAKWFQTAMADDALHVDGAGVMDKAQFIKAVAACEVKSVALDDFKFIMLDKNSAMITFVGTQDAVCGGQAQPKSVRASSVYVKRGGKWLNAFYTEIPLVQ